MYGILLSVGPNTQLYTIDKMLSIASVYSTLNPITI